MTWTPQTIGAASLSGQVTTAQAVAYPTGIQAGDTLFLLCACSVTTQTWTFSDTDFTSMVSVAAGTKLQIFWKVANGTESGTFTVTNAAAKNTWRQCARFSGGPTLANFLSSIVATHTASGSSGSGIPRLPSLPIGANPNCLLIGGGAKVNNASGFNVPSVFDAEIGHGSTATDALCFVWDYAIQTTAADIASGSWTLSTGDSSLSSSGIIAAILPGIATVQTPTRSLMGVGT